MARQRLKKSHLRTKHTQGVDTCWDIILLPFCWSCDQLSSWVFSLCANNSGDSTDVLLYIVSAFYFWILNKCYTQSALSVSFNCFLVSHVIASGICSVEEFSRLLISHIESTILFFFFFTSTSPMVLTFGIWRGLEAFSTMAINPEGGSVVFNPFKKVKSGGERLRVTGSGNTFGTTCLWTLFINNFMHFDQYYTDCVILFVICLCIVV